MDRNVADVELAGRVLDVEAVVAALNLDRFALAGVDIGAATAVAYAVGNLAKISRLVLLSPWSSGAKYLAIPALRAAYAAEHVSAAIRSCSRTCWVASRRVSRIPNWFGCGKKAT